MVPLQVALTIVAGAALYALWRYATRIGGRAALIITAGFLLRALAAQALFWISWLRLPVARSLQLGDGFWFFAVDSPGYLAYADLFARRALHISYPSRTFVQIFGVFVAMFGSVASTAILLNCAAYLGTCAVIVALARRRPSAALHVTLAAIALGPAGVLWSLQPLKDTLFVFFVTAMIAACAWWKESGRVAAAVAMVILSFALGGLRWYFAAFLCAAWAVFALIAVVRRERGVIASAAMLVLIAGATIYGGRYDMPARVFLRSSPIERVEEAGKGFATVTGATTIQPGPRIAKVKAPPAPPPAAAPVAVPVAAPAKTQPPPSPQLMPAPQPLPATTPPPPAPPPPPPAPARFAADAFATFLPRFVAQPLGLLRVGGGRGLWMVVDADTLVFDAVIVLAIVFAVRARARTPLFVMVVLLFLLTAVPLIYVVNNFGTLFRLREMLYLLAALIPVTIAREAAAAGGAKAGR